MNITLLKGDRSRGHTLGRMKGNWNHPGENVRTNVYTTAIERSNNSVLLCVIWLGCTSKRWWDNSTKVWRKLRWTSMNFVTTLDFPALDRIKNYMSQIRLPGPVCRFMAMLDIDFGTLCRIASPLPGPVGTTSLVNEAKNPSGSSAPELIKPSPSAQIYSLLIEESAVYGKGKFKNTEGNTEYVELVRQATGAPQTSSWKSGLHVRSAEPDKIARGTAIATFDDNGKYPTDALGKHAAIYLSHNGEGIQVLDQWNSQGEVKQRLIKFNRPSGTNRSNNGDTFYVIGVRD